MNIAIVGASVPDNEELIKSEIRKILNDEDNPILISGGAKGVDTIASKMAEELGVKSIIFLPQVMQWDPPNEIGYKARNIQIAEYCDKLYCFPARLRDRRCYHCDADHQVSGGCWTMWYARKKGKETKIILL